MQLLPSFHCNGTGVRATHRHQLHTQALNVGGVSNGFKPKLVELSCERHDWACGMEEMSSDTIGAEGTEHPPAHILT